MTALLGFLAAFFAVALLIGLIVFAIWAKKKGWKFKWKWGCVVAAIVAAIVVAWAIIVAISAPSAVVTVAQIYPNYDFPEGVNQITVPLIPAEQQLTREAGGWVITPPGSEGRIDCDVLVVIEYIDGRKFKRYPKQPVPDGVRPANQIFRLYGAGEATVTIHRDVYVNRWK